MALTGNQATLVVGTDSWDAVVIGPLEQSRPVLNASLLSTTTFELVGPGDIADAGSLEVEILYDPDDPPPVGGAADTSILFYKAPSGKAVGATRVGSAFISAVSTGAVENNAYMRGSYVLHWSGGTSGITSTDATTSIDAWGAGTDYDIGAIVSYSGSNYIAIGDPTTGDVPGVDPDWQVFT